MRHRQPDQRGFTLVEVIVALVILGLIMGLLGTSARLLRGTGDRIVERGTALGDVALVTGLLQERLGDAVALDFGPEGRHVASFDGTAAGARFLTLSLGFAPGEPLVAMAIGAADGGGVELRLAELAADDPSFAALDLQERLERRRLAPEVTGLRLGYFGRKRGASAPAWHAEWRDEPRLPRAVRLELDHAALDLPPIIVPIRQSLGSLCPTAHAGAACGEQ